MDEQEHSASPETPADPAGLADPARPAGSAGPAVPASGETVPVTGPAAGPGAGADPGPGAGPGAGAGLELAAGPGRDRRADGFREALTSRGAGWAVAAAMTGVVVGLSVAMAASSPTVVVQPEGVAGRGGAPPGALRAAVPGGAVRALPPVRLRLVAPGARAQVPAGGPLPAPARLRLQIPAERPLQAPSQLRILAPVPGAAGTLIPVPRIQLVPGGQMPTAVLTLGAVRLRIRPGQVRVRLRVPANAPIRVLPGGLPGPLRVAVPGPRPVTVLPAGVTPARLRIAFEKGQPLRARLVLPAHLPGQARLRIQIPARARVTPALPAPPNW